MATNKKTIRDVDVHGKRVLVRVDFNVPLDGNGTITDDTRIRASLPTIQYLLGQSAAVILASHLGRPKGKVVESLRLTPVARRVAELLARPVKMAPDSVGPDVEEMAINLRPGEVLLLENLRFHPDEEANDPQYSRKLANLAEVYVDDAFGSAHRAHASTAGVASYLPAVAGLLMEKELKALGGVVGNPRRPFVVIIGGAKISSKIGVLSHLLDSADTFLIGGGMANTLLKSKGIDVAASLSEDDKLAVAREFLTEAKQRGRSVLLPVDAVIARAIEEGTETRTVSVDSIPPAWSIVDIGPKTVRAFAAALEDAQTVLWNGPMGIFEIPTFATGTRDVAQIVADSSAYTIVGGGDSVAAVEQMGFTDRITHISTGGGASLEFLEGRELPGVAVLEDCK